MKIVNNVKGTNAPKTLRDALSTVKKGRLCQVRHSPVTVFAVGEYLLMIGGETMVSLTDYAVIDKEDLGNWEEVVVVELPAGFQLTLEQE